MAVTFYGGTCSRNHTVLEVSAYNKATDVHHKIWFHQPQHITKVYKVFKLQKSLHISEPLKESSYVREHSKLYMKASLLPKLDISACFLCVLFAQSRQLTKMSVPSSCYESLGKYMYVELI